MSMLTKVLIGLGVVVVVVIGGVFAYAATLPDTWHIERSSVIPAPPEAIFPLLNEPRRWPEWTAWTADRDPEGKYAYDGPATGVGAKTSWDGPKMGKGRMEFIKVEPNRLVEYHLWFDENPDPSSGALKLEPAAGGTRVTWTDDGDMHGSLIGRLFIPMIAQYVEPDFDTGLANLKRLAGEGKLKAPEPPAPAATATDQAVPATPTAQ